MMESAGVKLSQYHIPDSNAAFYISEFITPEEEEYLIRKVELSPVACSVYLKLPPLLDQ